MDREARGDKDAGVHKRNRDRQLVGLGRPRALVDDAADKEVRSEERPEQHRLGDDEEKNPERLTVDLRALVGLGWAVMLVLGGGIAVSEGYGGAFHQSAP